MQSKLKYNGVEFFGSQEVQLLIFLLQVEQPLRHGKHILLLGSSMKPSPQWFTQSLFFSNGN